jgi:gliding motility-associated-like protein
VGAIFQMVDNANAGVWYSRQGNVATIDSFTGSIAAISAGTTVITYTILTDTNGCTNASQFNVRILGAPDFSIDSSIRQIKCYGVDDAQIAMTVNGGQGHFSYLWSSGDTTASITNLSKGTYAVNITETATKCSLSDTFIILQPDSFYAIPMIAKEFCKRNDGSIQFQVTGGVRPYTYEWVDNNTDSVRLGLVTGEYSVVITDSNKCNLSLSVVIEEDTCNVNVYDALTPNSDGINDTWIIDGIQYYPDNLVQVFDKIGDLVYEKMSYNNTWGGEGKNGGLLPDGTYYYVIKINSENVKGGHNIQTGAVLIKR